MARCACGRAADVRVRVDLSHFYSDERARVLLCVPGARSVRRVARRLRALCGLPPDLLLLADGHVLPPAQRLAALPPDTQLAVLPAPPHVLADTPALVACAAPPPRDALAESKRRALHELERLCAGRARAHRDGRPAHDEECGPHERTDELWQPQENTLEVVGDVEETPRARRRRVRRRRAAPYHGEGRGAPSHGEGRGAPYHEEGRGSRPPRVVTALVEGTDLDLHSSHS